ncbi:hypothetical protein [Paenibacillus sp. UNC496MF]|uniref:hypothetical protein n=1 Tax=Paenibacillus sp. UNC496MF TaxID=1502753 RepID=UPI0035293892
MPAHQEALSRITEKGRVDLSSYFDREIIETGYVLSESKFGYNRIICYILEVEGDIIGSYLALNISVLEKVRYNITEGPIKPMATFTDLEPGDFGESFFGVGKERDTAPFNPVKD